MVPELYKRLISLKNGGEKNYQFSTRIGVSEQALYTWRRGRTPDRPSLEKISEATGANIDWLLTGQGEKLSRSWMSEQIAAGAELLGRPSGAPIYIEDGSELPAKEFIQVPLLEGRVTAGPDGGLLEQSAVDWFPFKRLWAERRIGRGSHLDHLVLVRISGDSMVPTISAGELVMIDTYEAECDHIRDSKIYLVRLPDGETVLKRLVRAGGPGGYRLLCSSDNPRFPAFELEIPPDRPLSFYVLGRARWSGKEFD